MEFSALYYTPEQLSNALHSYLLKENNSISLRLNQKQMGLGGDNSWGAKALEPYLIKADKPYEYSFTLKPVNTADIDKTMADSKVQMPETEGHEQEKADKSKLAAAIKDAEAVDTKQYTEDSVAKMTTVLKKAKEVFANDLATQEEVDEAEKALRDALNKLVKKTGSQGNGGQNGNQTTKPNKPNGQNKPVKTGDATPFTLLFGGLAVSLGTILGLKKRKDNLDSEK